MDTQLAAILLQVSELVDIQGPTPHIDLTDEPLTLSLTLHWYPAPTSMSLRKAPAEDATVDSQSRDDYSGEDSTSQVY